MQRRLDEEPPGRTSETLSFSPHPFSRAHHGTRVTFKKEEYQADTGPPWQRLRQLPSHIDP